VDLPDFERDRVLVLVVRRRRRRVQLGLDRPERLDQRQARFDRAHIVPLWAAWPGRHRTTTSNHTTPTLRRGDRRTERLGDDRGVGRVAREHGLQRTVAGALLLDDRLDVHGGARR
jgi:hypothetical protein